MAATKTVQELNRELADKLAEEGKSHPQHPYFGKFVGIANGQVVVVADNLNDLYSQLHQIEPDPMNTFGIEVGRDFDIVEEIWGFSACRAFNGR